MEDDDYVDESEQYMAKSKRGRRTRKTTRNTAKYFMEEEASEDSNEEEVDYEREHDTELNDGKYSQLNLYFITLIVA